MAEDPIADQTVPTEERARAVAKMIGCEGAHKWRDGWAPCEAREGLMILIREGVKGYRAWQDRRKRRKKSAVIIRKITEEELKRRRKRQRRYTIERVPNEPDEWEDLGQRGVSQIQGGSPGVTVGRGGNFGG